jgi:hypothetical protein
MVRPQIGFRLRDDERERLADYATRNGCASLSAALRHALPPDIFEEPIKVGRPLGYSPKRAREVLESGKA